MRPATHTSPRFLFEKEPESSRVQWSEKWVRQEDLQDHTCTIKCGKMVVLSMHSKRNYPKPKASPKMKWKRFWHIRKNSEHFSIKNSRVRFHLYDTTYETEVTDFFDIDRQAYWVLVNENLAADRRITQKTLTYISQLVCMTGAQKSYRRIQYKLRK